MEARFIPVASAEALDDLLARSEGEPVLLFKHSTTCPISAAAYQQMSRLDAEVPIIVVQRSREVSNEVAARTGVRHESPQALVLRGGRVIWSASHWDVTADAVKKALEEQG